MRHSAAIGIAAYIAFVGGVVGGAYAAFEAAIAAPAQTASAGVVKQGPGFPASRKWTPVEIKRDVADQLPPLPPYVTPSSEARARVAKNLQKRAVVVAQRAAPKYEQRTTEQRMASAYAPVEEPRSFFPFNFRF
jgi:hypothetical protein